MPDRLGGSLLPGLCGNGRPWTDRQTYTVASIQIYYEGANFFPSQRGERSPRPKGPKPEDQSPRPEGPRALWVLGERAASPLATN